MSKPKINDNCSLTKLKLIEFICLTNFQFLIQLFEKCE